MRKIYNASNHRLTVFQTTQSNILHDQTNGRISVGESNEIRSTKFKVTADGSLILQKDIGIIKSKFALDTGRLVLYWDNPNINDEPIVVIIEYAASPNGKLNNCNKQMDLHDVQYQYQTQIRPIQTSIAMPDLGQSQKITSNQPKRMARTCWLVKFKDDSIKYIMTKTGDEIESTIKSFYNYENVSRIEYLGSVSFLSDAI